MDIKNLNKMVGNNNSLFIDDSKLLLNRALSIPHIHTLFIRSIFPILTLIRLFIK